MAKKAKAKKRTAAKKKAAPARKKKRAVKAIEALDGSKRIGIVITNDYVTHAVCFSSMSSSYKRFICPEVASTL